MAMVGAANAQWARRRSRGSPGRPASTRRSRWRRRGLESPIDPGNRGTEAERRGVQYYATLKQKLQLQSVTYHVLHGWPFRY